MVEPTHQACLEDLAKIVLEVAVDGDTDYLSLHLWALPPNARKKALDSPPQSLAWPHFLASVRGSPSHQLLVRYPFDCSSGNKSPLGSGNIGRILTKNLKSETVDHQSHKPLRPRDYLRMGSEETRQLGVANLNRLRRDYSSAVFLGIDKPSATLNNPNIACLTISARRPRVLSKKESSKLIDQQEDISVGFYDEIASILGINV